MHESHGFRYSPFPVIMPNHCEPSYRFDQADYCNHLCKSHAGQYPSGAIWLLIPAAFGTVVSLLSAFSLGKPERRTTLPRHGAAVTVSYTALATVAFSFYVFQILQDKDKDLQDCFLPLSIGLAIIIGYYGAAYFFLNQLNPYSFSGDLGDDQIDQFLTFVYFSITTFATAQDGDIKPNTLSAKSLVSMEVLTFLYIFTLGIMLFTSARKP